MLKSGYLWQTIGADGQPNGGALDAYAWVAFPAKGFTVNNVLSPGRAPMIASSARLGTQYGLDSRTPSASQTSLLGYQQNAAAVTAA